MSNKNILLIEPGYKNKYPPLGLMKIAQYHGPRGKNDNVVFVKGEDKDIIGKAWDRIYITTLFSFEWKRIAQTIDFAIKVANGETNKIFVGGIAASLMHDIFVSQSKWTGIRFIKGLLNSNPADSLKLDSFQEELYSSDSNGTPIEDLVPDYSILDQIEYKYPVNDAYFIYASRGCIRKCKFCGVPPLEGEMRDTYSVTRIVKGIEELYGSKKDLTFMDNNVVASPRFKEIIAEIRDLGFTPGAKLRRGNSFVLRRVDFNQGVDARILCKNSMYLKELSTIAIKPLRIAFDHWGLRKPYEKSIRYAAEFGLKDLSNYMLYNFMDTPQDLFERMRLNVTLNEELNIRIFSFPMRYQPIRLPDRSHVGKNWNKYFLRSMQIILHATHGIVSGSPVFFKSAFGDTFEDYLNILYRPHHFIFNRFWFEFGEGRGQLDEYKAIFKKLSKDEKNELINYLCETKRKYIANKKMEGLSPLVRAILPFYKAIDIDVERQIWDNQKKISKKIVEERFKIAADELVEDANLGIDELITPTKDEVKV